MSEDKESLSRRAFRIRDTDAVEGIAVQRLVRILIMGAVVVCCFPREPFCNYEPFARTTANLSL
jgi:hypothetical protein